MIRIQNIYYMLAYAFQVLREQVYESCGTEEFENTADLLSAILAKGVATQIKRGLDRTYNEETEPLSCLRGKIRVTESIKQQTLMKQQLICTYDEFSVDSYMNRILKTTMELLLRYDIPKARKKELRNLLLYFKEVTTLDVHSINWNFSVKISLPLENTGVSSVFATSFWPFSLIFSLARRNEGNFFQAVPTTLSSSLAEVRLASLVAWA